MNEISQLFKDKIIPYYEQAILEIEDSEMHHPDEIIKFLRPKFLHHGICLLAARVFNTEIKMSFFKDYIEIGNIYVAEPPFISDSIASILQSMYKRIHIMEQIIKRDSNV